MTAAACFIASAPLARAGDAETIAAVNKASAALDAAFESRNAEAVKAMMTPDHEAVTPYYDGPKSVSAQIASISDLTYEQTIVGETRVQLLGPGAAIRTFKAKLDGTFKGRPIAPRVFVTSIMVKDGDAWLERFYQVTAMEP